MDEPCRHYDKQNKPDMRTNTLRFHLHELRIVTFIKTKRMLAARGWEEWR
jgi:hypothetical protein